MKGSIIQRGKKSWRLKFDIGRDPATGRRQIHYSTVKGTRQDAERKLIELLDSIGRGSYVAPSKVTVAEHVRARVAQWTAAGTIGPKTAERYRQLTEAQIVPFIGGIALQKIGAGAIESWHSTLQARGRADGRGGISARTVRHAHRLLSKCLDDAVRHDLASRNVATVQSPPKVETEEVVILNADQVRLVLDGLRGRPLYAIVALALATGMRRSEILALRWSNVDLETKTIRVRESLEQTQAGVRFKAPKTKAGRRDVTLPDDMIPILRDHRRLQLEQRLALGRGKSPDDALVFPNRDPNKDESSQSPNTLTKEWQRAAAGFGVDVSFHALRHTHASQLIARGIPITMISRRLGHASPKVTLEVYSHMFETTDTKAAEAMNAALAGLLRP